MPEQTHTTLLQPQFGCLLLISVTLSCLAHAQPQEQGSLSFMDSAGHVIREKTLPNPYLVKLRDQQVDLRDHVLDPSNPLPDHAMPLIITLTGPTSTDNVSLLETAGAQVIGPMPPAGYLVLADARTRKEIAKLEAVAVMAVVESEWKLSPRLPPGPLSSPLEIVLFPGAAPDPVMELLEQLGEVQWVQDIEGRYVIGTLLSSGEWSQVADLPEVEMIDIAGVGALMNNEVRVVMQTENAHHAANQSFYNPVYYMGVWGKGQIVTLADSGLQDHEVFARPNQVVANAPAANSCVLVTGDSVNHGTGVAATLLGDSLGQSGGFNTANDYDGLALGAELIMQDIVDENDYFCPPQDYIKNLFDPAWYSGSMVHSNSWGHNAVEGNPQGAYSWRSQMIDSYLHQATRREQSIIFAAGNAGMYGTAYVPYSLSDEAHAKNAIAVGGSGNGSARDFMYPYSSRGPANDCAPNSCGEISRVKPDVVAPAHYYVETADTGGYSDYTIFPGTSVAAPAVAGAAALVRDYFAQGFYPVKSSDPPLSAPPSSALVKAMLINSTVPIYDPSGYMGNLGQGLAADAYPNYDQGYGRPVLDQVLEPAGYRKLKVYENSSTTSVTGAVWQVRPKLRDRWGANCNTLRVTLVWNDPAGPLLAGPKLVNDLDLEVEFDSTIYYGNHLLNQNAAFDTVNNVEDVFIPMGQQQNAQLRPVIRVYGSSVPAGPQPFALVVTYGACAGNLSCLAGSGGARGCYRGPGDTVPGSSWNPPPGCDEQEYSSEEFIPGEAPYPHCKSKGGRKKPIPIGL
jgi:subtilisin family serine protease